MKNLISTLVLSFLMLMAFGQDLKINFDPITIPSPNAASLGVYGEVPVDLCHGLTNISIPIYEIKYGNLSVPLSINYRGSGLKLNQYPSWVGQNWTLFAGGTITRVTKGIPDESIMKREYPCQDSLGYYYNYSNLGDSIWRFFPEILDNYPYMQGTQLAQSLCNDYLDAEPDEFVFNFNGISGKFYLDHHGQWKVASNEEIKVICTRNDIKNLEYNYPWDISYHPENMFYKFTLITAEGTQYVFGGVRDAIEFSRREIHSVGKSFPIATSWNLTKIISPERNDSIMFEYERKFDDLILHVFNPVKIFRFIFLDYDNAVDSADNETLTSYLVEPSYLKRIVTNNQIVEFKSQKANNSLKLNHNHIDLNWFPGDFDWQNRYNYGDMRPGNRTPKYSNQLSDCLTVTRKLDSIVVLNKLNEDTIRLFVLDYVEDPQERLKLQSFKTVASNPENSPEYTFEYYQSIGYSFTEQSTDHWGYAGKWAVYPPINYGWYDIPRKFDLSFIDDESELWDYFQGKEPNVWPHYYLSDALKRINYPTGGSTEFEYEQHDYSSAVYRVPGDFYQLGYPDYIADYRVDTFETKMKAGGLRIKKIISNDNNGNEQTKEYFYVRNYLPSDTPETLLDKPSSGLSANKMAQSPGDMLTVLNPYLRRATINYSNMLDGQIHTDQNALLHYFSDNPWTPLAISDGNSIAYREVVERNYENGYIKYTYGVPHLTHDLKLDAPPLYAINSTYYSKFTSRDLMRNKLLEKGFFNENGDSVKKISFTYMPDYYRLVDPDAWWEILALPSDVAIRTRSLEMNPEINNFDGFGTYQFMIGSANLIYIFNNHLLQTYEETYFQENTLTSRTEYEYGGLNDNFLTNKYEWELDSDGSMQMTSIKYSSDYEIIDPSSDFEHAIIGLQQNHIIVPIEITKSIDPYDFTKVEGKLDEYKCFSENVIKPVKTYNLNTDGTYYENIRFNAYDDFGNLLDFTPVTGINTGLIWDNNQNIPIAKIVNAKKSEIFHENFENQNNFVTNIPASYSFDPGVKRTGKKSLKISKAGTGEAYVFMPFLDIDNNEAKKYKYSAWVYSDNPSYDLYFFRKTQNDGDTSGYSIPAHYVTSNVTNKWVYIEGEVDVTSDIKCLFLRVDNNGGGNVWFDDLRLYPSEAKMTTYTHDPLIGMTSQTDQNGKTTYYEHDGLGRLIRIRDHENNILQEYKYNYATQNP